MFRKLIFDISTKARRYQKLWNEGLLIGSHRANGKLTHLYMLHDFFVEVKYDERQIEQIKEIHSFSSLTDKVKAAFFSRVSA